MQPRAVMLFDTEAMRYRVSLVTGQLFSRLRNPPW